MRVCACVRLILVLVGKTLILILVWGTYYVPATYVPGISRQTTVWYIPPKTFARVRVCSTNLGYSGENTNLGFSVGYVLCTSYVCTWYQPADHSMVPGTYVQYRATSKNKKKTPGTSERFVANCGVGPSTRGQGDSASLVKPTQDQRR